MAAVACTKSEDRVRSLFIQNSKLIDPFSTQFRNLRYASSTRIDPERRCGEVNAKNAIGGYNGWSEFSITAIDAERIYVMVETSASLSGNPDVDQLIRDSVKRDCENTVPIPKWLLF
jgi:hypothetical protein